MHALMSLFFQGTILAAVAACMLSLLKALTQLKILTLGESQKVAELLQGYVPSRHLTATSLSSVESTSTSCHCCCVQQKTLSPLSLVKQPEVFYHMILWCVRCISEKGLLWDLRHKE